MPFAIEQHGGVAVARYHAPPRNFLTLRAIEQLRRLMHRLNRDPGVRVIVLTGVDDDYMLHLEVGELRRLFGLARAVPRLAQPLVRGWLRLVLWAARVMPRSADVLLHSPGERALAMNALGHVLVLGELIERSPKVTIAAVNGPCIGGGLELSMCCDYRIAVDDDDYLCGLPEVLIGLMPGFGGSVRSANLIGARAATELLLSGELITPARAAELGLYSEIVAPERFCRHVIDTADRLAEHDPAAVSAIKRARRPASRRALFEELASVTELARRQSVHASLDRYAALLGSGLALPAAEQPDLRELLGRMRAAGDSAP